MKDTPREQFRWAAHTGGLATVKDREYEEDASIEAANPYAAWKALQAEGRSLRPGDLLSLLDQNGNSSELHIAKYIGFEPAQWLSSMNNTDSSFPSGKTPESSQPTAL